MKVFLNEIIKITNFGLALCPGYSVQLDLSMSWRAYSQKNVQIYPQIQQMLVSEAM